MSVLQGLLALGFAASAVVPFRLADALWSLAGALVLTALVVWLARISMRQRSEEVWRKYGGEDDEPTVLQVH